MYYPIQLKLKEELTESTNLGDIYTQFITEAVFDDGKSKVAPLSEYIQKIKDELDNQLQEQSDSNKAHNADKKVKVKNFDPKLFWKNTLFQDFENEIIKIFGFRDVSINPYIEKYNSTTKKFESCELNCYVYHADRFPVEGLLTEKGFYDKTHSTRMEIWISLGLLQKLSADEILAVFLHEFGHGIDPALVDIKYTGTNILTKYITNRKSSINKSEERVMKKMHKFGEIILAIGGIYVILILFMLGSSALTSIAELFQGKEKVMQKRLSKIKTALENDQKKNGKFNKDTYSEAFADNFARMYGYGTQLMSALRKMSKETDKELKSRFAKEKIRQRVILDMTMNMINDVHKTDIHRIRSLINEYNKDINNPETPPVVKKQLQEDLTELEKVLDQYLNHKDEFQKRVNNLINDELKKLEEKDTDSKEKDDKKEEKSDNESSK